MVPMMAISHRFLVLGSLPGDPFGLSVAVMDSPLSLSLPLSLIRLALPARHGASATFSGHGWGAAGRLSASGDGPFSPSPHLPFWLEPGTGARSDTLLRITGALGGQRVRLAADHASAATRPVPEDARGRWQTPLFRIVMIVTSVPLSRSTRDHRRVVRSPARARSRRSSSAVAHARTG